MLRLAALILPIIALCACATPASQAPPALSFDLPATWSPASANPPVQAASLALWWQRFDDPLLGTLVTRAVRSNTSVTTAQAALRQAWALRDVARAALLPTLNGTASAQRNTTGGAVADGANASNLYQAGLNANWVPDVFGANRGAFDAAQAAALSSSASLGDVQVAIAAQAGLSYIGLRGAQVRLQIANDNLASAQETLQITLWRQQAGLGSALEAEQARAAAEQTRALVPALQIVIEQSRHALAVLTGQPPAALATLLAGAGPVPQAAPDLAMSIPADTLRQRADVRAAELKVTAALARVSQARAARLPSFALGGSLGLNALTVSALSGSAAVVSSLFASIAAPLFDGGAGRAQVLAQQAAYDQARIAYEAAVLAALKDVEDALTALAGDRGRRLSLRLAADAAASASLLARQRYSTGLIDFQVVLETQRTQLSTQDSVAAANADVSADYVRLYKALGGGWQPGTVSAGLSPPTPPGPALGEQVNRSSTQ